MSVLLALLLVQAAPVAPSPSDPTATAIDPARLQAARSLLDVLMPQDTRDSMIDAMLRPMMANIQQAMTSDPSFQKLMGSDPAVRDVFDRFMTRRNAAMLQTMRAGLPGMIDAMTRAYARRLTVRQLDDARAFFSTPSGAAYMRQSTTIMADPDIQAWQRSLMQRSMGDIQGELTQVMTEMRAAGEKK